MAITRYAKRTDLTAKTLIAYARSRGAQYLPLDGTLDGALKVGRVQRLVDWKTPGATLTPEQARLVAAGWQIAFLSTPAQVDAEIGQMQREA